MCAAVGIEKEGVLVKMTVSRVEPIVPVKVGLDVAV